jgi:hypothetical protein
VAALFVGRAVDSSSTSTVADVETKTTGLRWQLFGLGQDALACWADDDEREVSWS